MLIIIFHSWVVFMVLNNFISSWSWMKYISQNLICFPLNASIIPFVFVLQTLCDESVVSACIFILERCLVFQISKLERAQKHATVKIQEVTDFSLVVVTYVVSRSRVSITCSRCETWQACSICLHIWLSVELNVSNTTCAELYLECGSVKCCL